MSWIEDGTFPIPLRRRSRLWRAMRWPQTLWRYRRAGVPWRVAWYLTWWIIWYPQSPPRFWFRDEKGRIRFAL